MPGLGAGGGKYAISVGWNYAYANKSYFDSRLNHDFTRLWRPQERLSVLDVTGSYAVNRRLSVQMTLPIVMNEFSQLYPPLGENRSMRHGFDVNGIGDVSIYGQSWLLDPKDHKFGNFALGAGLKLPTGNWNAKAVMPDETGRNFTRRAVYPAAMQPGDGGVGIIVGYQFYKILRRPSFLRSLTVYSSGSYLISPRDSNGTRSIVANLGVPLLPIFIGRQTNSVADAYHLEGGVAWRPPFVWDKPKLKTLRLRAFTKIEGQTAYDLIGGEKGFRQPGYAFSVGPGVTYSIGKNTFIVDAPIVFNRHIDPGASAVPGLPVRGRPAAFNPNRQMGLVAPASISLRYVRAF